MVSFILTGALTLSLSYITMWLRRYKGRNNYPFWISVMEDLLLALSDQQLVTGLLLLVISYAKWPLVPGLNNNLQAAADLTYFSSITHCTTLMTLAPYFRRHP